MGELQSNHIRGSGQSEGIGNQEQKKGVKIDTLSKQKRGGGSVVREPRFNEVTRTGTNDHSRSARRKVIQRIMLQIFRLRSQI